MTLGQEFVGFAVTLAEDHASFQGLIKHLGEINLGATAVGTGIAADPRFAEAARKAFAEKQDNASEAVALSINAPPAQFSANSASVKSVAFRTEGRRAHRPIASRGR